jgi:hypothetical protein
MEEENESLFAFLKMIFQLLCFPEVFYTAIFYEDAQLLQRDMLFMTWCSEVHCRGAVAADPH